MTHPAGIARRGLSRQACLSALGWTGTGKEYPKLIGGDEGIAVLESTEPGFRVGYEDALRFSTRFGHSHPDRIFPIAIVLEASIDCHACGAARSLRRKVSQARLEHLQHDLRARLFVLRRGTHVCWFSVLRNHCPDRKECTLTFQQGLRHAKQRVEQNLKIRVIEDHFRSESLVSSGVSVVLSKPRWEPSGSVRPVTHMLLPTWGSEAVRPREMNSR